MMSRQDRSHPLICRGGASRRGAGAGRPRGGHAGGGQPGTWRIHRGAARLGQPVLRASCPLSGPGHPRDRLGRAMTSTVVNSKTCEISEPGASMLAFLRSDLGLTAVKLGCGRMRAARERARGRRAGPGVPDQGRRRGRTLGHHDRRAGWLRWRGLPGRCEPYPPCLTSSWSAVTRARRLRSRPLVRDRFQILFEPSWGVDTLARVIPPISGALVVTTALLAVAS